MLGSTWSEAFQRGGQDGKEATHSGADHHCTAGGRGGSGPRQIREVWLDDGSCIRLRPLYRGHAGLITLRRKPQEPRHSSFRVILNRRSLNVPAPHLR